MDAKDVYIRQAMSQNLTTIEGKPLKMSSGASGNNTMNDNCDIINSSDDIGALTAEGARLLTENAELRKLMGLMQENLELRSSLRDHERKARSLSPPRQRRTEKDIKGEISKPLSCPHADSKDEIQQTDSLPHLVTKDEILQTDSRPHLDKIQQTDLRQQLDPEKFQQCQRIVGEIAFQLDRRILCTIFIQRNRLYGYRVANIEDKIKQVTTCPLTGKVDDKLRSELDLRYHHTMTQLKKLGYDPSVHPYYTEYLVNTYGIMKDRTTGAEDLFSFNDPQFLGKMISEYMPSDNVKDILVLLQCLAYLAKEDGKCLFIW